MNNNQTEVLVVGAGPVGLLTAVLLAEAGIRIEIIDREERTTARSYACALHPHSLELLDRLGLADALVQAGRPLSAVTFYDGASRHAEFNFADVGAKFPFLLVLSQSILEEALEQRLHKTGLAVKWNHRFDSFESQEHGVEVTVEKLGGTGTGYIVPHWETVVQKRSILRTRFLVGADGHGSLVRQRSGIQYERLPGPESFVAYEFASDIGGEDEVRVVLDDHTTNVLWPMPNKKFRWTFQLIHREAPSEFPEKARDHLRFPSPGLDNEIRRYIQRVTGYRAPWFTAAIHEISWGSQVGFEHGLVRQFGRDHCWLAGDAAHQTGPVGVQSMNAGLCEAEALAGKLTKVLREEAPRNSLATYDNERQTEWRRLLGLSGSIEARAGADEWVGKRLGRILPCLPATGEHLTQIVEHFGLAFPNPSCGEGTHIQKNFKLHSSNFRE